MVVNAMVFNHFNKPFGRIALQRGDTKIRVIREKVLVRVHTIVGKITSAVYSPRLKQNIALAMVSINSSEIGTILDVKMNDKIIKATVVENPFYDPKKKLASS